MANREQLAMLKRDITQWNEWREANPELFPDLRRANLRETDLRKAKLNGANLSGARLNGARLNGATCAKANFTHATLIRTQLDYAKLTNAQIYGISAWDLQLKDAVHQDLIITPFAAPNTITVDDLEVAQFIYCSSTMTAFGR